MVRPTYVVIVLFFVTLIIYLFVTAPVPLQTSTKGQLVETKKVLEIINAMNAQVRNLYTQQIVGAGKKQNLKFDEDWQDEDVNAGPLPAQFLREMAKNLEKNSLQLGLYLGSDYPINSANLFSGEQMDFFQQLKRSNKPVFFYTEDIDRFGYMFADRAIAKPCIQCHNKHADSPKIDWKMNDVMGATTWTYPDKLIDLETALVMIDALRESVRSAYAIYIEKIKTIDKPPLVSKRWPVDGYYLPSIKSFMQEVDKRSSTESMIALLSIVNESVEYKQNRE